MLLQPRGTGFTESHLFFRRSRIVINCLIFCVPGLKTIKRWHLILPLMNGFLGRNQPEKVDHRGCQVRRVLLVPRVRWEIKEKPDQLVPMVIVGRRAIRVILVIEGLKATKEILETKVILVIEVIWVHQVPMVHKDRMDMVEIKVPKVIRVLKDHKGLKDRRDIPVDL